MNKTFLYSTLSLVLTSSAFAQTSVHPMIPANSTAQVNENELSPQDWEELRVARHDVLKAHPELMAKATQMSAKMRAFQEKLNAAILKEDPKLEPIIAKMDNKSIPQRGPTPVVAPPPPLK